MQRDGRFQTEMVEVDGPIAYAETTTVARVFAEDANRCVLLSTDERPEQTRQVLTHVARAYNGHAPRVDRSRLILVHHAIQRLLEPLPLGHLLRMIQACALLHQFQRPRDSEGRVVASEFDYAIGRTLLEDPLAKSMRGLSPSARRFCEDLRTYAERGERFSTRDAVGFAGSSERAVRGWLAELHAAGVIQRLSGKRGNKPSLWRLPHDLASRLRQAVCPLPAVEQLFGPRDNRRADSG
jgi:hypothetical protein